MYKSARVHKRHGNKLHLIKAPWFSKFSGGSSPIPICRGGGAPPTPQRLLLLRWDSAPATLQFPPATFFQFENPEYIWNNSYIWTAVVDQSEEWSGHGFEPRWSLDFFQASSFQLLKLENLLRWSFFTLIYNRSSNTCIWIISYILHITKKRVEKTMHNKVFLTNLSNWLSTELYM